jgi:tetratricopeptide (TPR) repeat protein
MKKIVLMLVAAFGVSTAFSQVDVGADYYFLGDYDNAEYYLQKHLASDPANANFYLGEIAFVNENPTLAAEYYNKALAADPNSMLAKVGMAKLTLSSNLKETEKVFKALAKEYKKSAPLAIAIGRAYLDNGMTVEATKKTSDAMGYNRSNADIYLLRGDILLAEGGDIGAVAGQYEQAKYFDEKALLPYLKLALIYERNSPGTALDNLRKANEANPGNTIVASLFGRVYTSLGRYPEAIEAITQAFAGGDYSTGDVERMARAYYFGEPDKLGMSAEAKFAEAEKWVKIGLERNPNHFIFNRFQMYLDAATNNPAGAADADKFFGLTPVGINSFLPQDYIMYGTIQANAGNAQEVETQFDKAISLAPDRLESYEEAIAEARKLREYALAAKYYKQMIGTKERVDIDKYENDKLLDINTLGNLYYQAGTLSKADSLTKRENLLRADELFTEMTELAPNSYTGYYYLARTANALYPGDTGIGNGFPMKHYSKTVSIIENREDDQPMSAIMLRALKEGLGYMAFYYYKTDDTANALIYSDKLLAIDPAHPNANAIKQDILSRE